MNIVVCEPDYNAGKLLSSLIFQWARRKGVESQIALQFYQSNEDLLERWENGMQIDMIMAQEWNSDEISGYSLAHRLVGDNERIPIVIILRNAFPDLREYQGDPLRFIVFPPNEDTIYSCMNSCWNQMEKNVSDLMLTIKERQRILRLPYSAIVFLEHSNRYTNVYMKWKSKPFMINRSLKACKNLLPIDQFIQCHRGYIINMFYVVEYSGSEIILLPNHIIPVGRTYKEQIAREFGSQNQALG